MTKMAGLTPKHFLWEVKDRIAWVRLNRPDQMNALNGKLLGELAEALTAADRPDTLRRVEAYLIEHAGTTPADNGGPLLDNVRLSTVPLPAGLGLLLSALGGFAVLRRRKSA